MVVEYRKLPKPDATEEKVEEVFDKVENGDPVETKEKGEWMKYDNQLLRAIDLLKGIKFYKGESEA